MVEALKLAHRHPHDVLMTGVVPETVLLGLDIGTTHGKAVLFVESGSGLATATRTSPRSTVAGRTVHADEHLWGTIRAVSAACCTALSGGTITAIGIASMAESGLLLDPATGAARSPFLPWFDEHVAW